jgi:hypothetical protein
MAAIKKVVAKKPLAKKQAGGSSKTTPFKDYLKSNKGASASDTVAMTSFGGKKSATKSGAMDIKAKNPKNQKALESAYEKTYGQDIKNRITNPAPGETNDQYNRRMGYKKGGVVKKAVVKKKK